MTLAPWTDREMLEALDLIERQGLSAARVAQRMGGSRSAVCGLMFRIKTDLAKVSDVAVRPANQDGGMPARWWDCAKQGRRA